MKFGRLEWPTLKWQYKGADILKKIGFEQVTNPEVAFVILFKNETELDRGTELAKRGFEAWSNPEGVGKGDFLPDFDTEDESWINCSGWAEPSIELLDRAGIDYQLIDVDLDENGSIIHEEDKRNISWIAF